MRGFGRLGEVFGVSGVVFEGFDMGDVIPGLFGIAFCEDEQG